MARHDAEVHAQGAGSVPLKDQTMKSGAAIAIASLIMTSQLSGCGAPSATESTGAVTTDVEAAPVVNDLTREARAWADSVMSGMTLEEMVGQSVMPAVYACDDAATMRLLRRYVADLHVGGVVLLKGELASASRMSAELMRLGRVMPFVAIDAEWGLAMRLADAPLYPANGSLGDATDEMLMYDYGREMARECRNVGINMILGPVVDVVSPGRGGVIGKRSFGGNPHRVSELSVAYAAGVESGGVMSVAKHFPGHGSPRGDSHKTLPVVSRDMEELDSIDLYPFRSYIDRGLSGVMVGHLAVPAVDSVSRPAAVSPPVIGGLLREKLGFRGLVLTDALNMAGACGYGAVDALSAGADIVLAPVDTYAEISGIMSALDEGRITADVIRERCRRILFFKYFLCAGNNRKSSCDVSDLRREVRSEESDSLLERMLRVTKKAIP